MYGLFDHKDAMPTFIQETKFKESDDQTNIDKFRVAISNYIKLIFLRIIIQNFMNIGQL